MARLLARTGIVDSGIAAPGADGQVLTSTGSAWNSEAAAVAGKIIQFETTESDDGTSSASGTNGTTLTPYDLTVPQISEGTQFMSRTITPISTSNKLLIQVTCHLANGGPTSAAVGIVTAALFYNAIVSAIACGSHRVPTIDAVVNITFTHVLTVPAEALCTYTVRGGSNTPGTVTFNGDSAAQRQGNMLKSSIRIWELAV